MGSIKMKMATLYALLVVAVMLSCGVLIIFAFRSAEYRKVYTECEYTAERIVDVLSVQELTSEEEVPKAFGEVVTSLLIETGGADTAQGNEKSVYLLSEEGKLLYSRRENLSVQDLSSRVLIQARDGQKQTEIYVHTAYDGVSSVADYVTTFSLTGIEHPYMILIRQPMETIQKNLENVIYIILMITLIGIVVAGVMGYFVASSISRPILKLTKKSQELASGKLEEAAGNPEEEKNEVPESDELGQLEIHFDEMAHELSSSIIELKAMEKMQKEFVANVSHELRTPITTIKSYVETLLDGGTDDPQMTKHFLSVVNQEADRMTTLVTDLLELSKMDSHQAVVVRKPTDLAALLYRDLSELMFEARKKGQILKWAPDMETEAEADVGERLPYPLEEFIILGDRHRLDQVFRNLLTNAMKYSPENSEIYAGIYRVTNEETGENEIRVKIEDHGIGIAKEDQENIFERFYRVDKARSRALGGTGLGLAIAKEITELHEGRIYVESELGKGSTFWVAFPEGSVNE